MYTKCVARKYRFIIPLRVKHSCRCRIQCHEATAEKINQIARNIDRQEEDHENDTKKLWKKKKKRSKKRLPITIFNIKNSLNSLRQTAHRHLIVSNRNGLIFCCAQWKKHKYELPNQIYLHTVTGEVLQRKVNGQRPIFCLVPSTLLVLRPDKEKTSA
jgi:hypothetical protein